MFLLTQIGLIAILPFSPRFAVVQGTVATIIQHSAEANARDWAAVPEFDNSEHESWDWRTLAFSHLFCKH